MIAHLFSGTAELKLSVHDKELPLLRENDPHLAPLSEQTVEPESLILQF